MAAQPPPRGRGAQLTWTAWTADGRAWRSTVVTWAEVPARGVVLVTGRWRGTRFIESGHDAVYFDGQQQSRTGPPFVGVNLPHPELAAVAERLADQGLLKFGVYMPDAAYEALWRRAREQGS